MSTNLEGLIDKYQGCRFPPFVAQNRDIGLINGKLLEIFQRGFAREKSSDMGIIHAADDYSNIDEKWDNANHDFDKYNPPPRDNFCGYIRKNPAINKLCESCNTYHAKMADNEKQVIAYMCHAGMIDFAMPVSIGDEVRMVLFCGQRPPSDSSDWDKSILEKAGIFKLIGTGDLGVNIWKEAKKRIIKIATKLNIKEKTLFDKIDKHITPKDVVSIAKSLETAGEEISLLATNTYELEKSKVVAGIRSSIAEALIPLSKDYPDIPEVWQRLKKSQKYFCKYFGFDYSIILTIREVDSTIQVQSLCGINFKDSLYEETTSDENKASEYRKLLRTLYSFQNISTIKPSDYVGLSIFKKIQVLLGDSKRNAFAVTVFTPQSTALFLFGCFQQNSGMSKLHLSDQDGLKSACDGFMLALKIILLIENLNHLAQATSLFLEDVAHDIRNPIQNILLKTLVVIRLAERQSEQLPRHLSRLAALSRRLHLLSERTWKLVEIQTGKLNIKNTNVNIYEIASECRASLLELADTKGINIDLNSDLHATKSVFVDRALFTCAFLNIMHNAIKYSYKNTKITVTGFRNLDNVILQISNRGIDVPARDTKRIFKRYYQSPNAVSFAGAGTGIGLRIVKEFADIYGKIDLTSEIIPGTEHYQATFSLTIEFEKQKEK